VWEFLRSVVEQVRPCAAYSIIGNHERRNAEKDANPNWPSGGRTGETGEVSCIFLRDWFQCPGKSSGPLLRGLGRTIFPYRSSPTNTQSVQKRSADESALLVF